ncbi:thymidylate synthase [Candidatus Pacearchaeota archaeon]|nr:thymidylate synthase [Candidatus Pacearchaeota archaeon]
MQAYLDIIREILETGVKKENRTGIDTIATSGLTFNHDMSKGFPLLTTKQMPFKCIASELEFFIKGITDKQWLQDRKNHIWDEWCSPLKVRYGHDDVTKMEMKQERDLGPIYGWQWRHFGAEYKSFDTPYTGFGYDQLANVVNDLKDNPNDRRMIVSAWNPLDLHKMALPPCHYSWQVTVTGDKLNLMWNQRSVDSVLGLPFNIASYGILLHLLARESNLREGKLTGFLGDTHIYANQMDGIEEQLSRTPYDLPKIKTKNFTSIFDWQYTDTVRGEYKSHDKISFDIAV